jgi:hypothetical protein
MIKFFLIALLQVLVASSLFAQQDQLRSARGDEMLIAQAAVSTTVPKEQTAPQVLPPLPQSENPAASPTPRLPSLDELDQMFKPSSLGKAADEARLHQQWRELSNRTVNDPDLVAVRRKAEAAPTDLEKRKRLRIYYTTYYDRMRAKAQTPELKTYIEAQKAQHLGALAQNRVRPSPSPLTSPSPSPSLSPLPLPPPPPLPSASP